MGRKLLAKSGFAKAAQEYVDKYDFYGFLLNTRNEDGSICREVGLMSKDGTLAHDAARFLMSYDGGMLQLRPHMDVGTPEPEVLANPPWCFQQNNTGASRKQVAPICLAFLESLA